MLKQEQKCFTYLEATERCQNKVAKLIQCMQDHSFYQVSHIQNTKSDVFKKKSKNLWEYGSSNWEENKDHTAEQLRSSDLSTQRYPPSYRHHYIKIFGKHQPKEKSLREGHFCLFIVPEDELLALSFT